MTLLSCLKADFYKQKRSVLWFLHILLPLGLVGLFLLYMRITNKQTISYVELYLEVLGFSFSFVIAIICGMVAQQEKEAGNFYVLLCIAQKRTHTFISKMILLFFMEAISIGIAILPLSFFFLKGSMHVWIWICISFFFANIFLYLQHFMISLRYGFGISAFIGIVESLVAALFLTGLGDHIWYVFPCSWSARMGVYVLRFFEKPAIKEAILKELFKQIGIGSVFVIVLLGISILWYNNWQGNQSVE